MREVPETIAGYHLERKLSAGGMGMVYLASRTSSHGFRKQVAIKLLLPHFFDREDIQRLFSDEARLAARLSHPNICQVFDFGVEHELYYLVMEFVDGVRICDILNAESSSHRFLPPELAARIVADAARGLHFAHQLRSEDGGKLGVIHRDISPENIIVTTAGFTKVLDFGIARWEERVSETVGNVVRGKAPYMSPEQVQGEPLDARSDVFSLGILLHELLSNRALFRRRSVVASMEAVLSDPIVDPVRHNPGVPTALSAVVAQALQRDRRERLASAEQLTLALEKVILQLGRPATCDSLARHIEMFTLPRVRAPRPDGSIPPNAFTRDHQILASGELTQTENAVAATPRPATEVLSEGDVWAPSSGRAAQGVTTDMPGSVRDAPTADLRTPPAAQNQNPGANSGQPDPELGDTAALPTLRRRGKIRAGLIGFALLAAALGGLALVVGKPEGRQLEAHDSDGRLEATGPVVAVPAGDAGPRQQADASVSVLDATRSTVDARDARPRKPRRTSRPAKPADRAAQKPPEAPSVEAASREGHGTLSVQAVPWGVVHVDGVNLGATPLIGHRLSAGPHQVEIYAPDSNQIVDRRTVQIEADQHHKVMVRKP